MRTALLLLCFCVSALWPQTAVFPGSIVSDTQLKVAKNRIQTSLRQAVSISDTIIVVANSTGIVANMLLTIDAEVMNVSSVAGNNITVTRAFDGTTAAAHSNGRTVSAYWTAWHHNVMAAEVKAIQNALGPGLSYVTGDPSTIFYSATYDFTPQTPGGALTNSIVNVVTLTPCPKGVNGSDTQHYLYISGGVGTAEPVKITGGTCLSEAASGTVTFTPAYDHTGAWTIESASDGIKEAAVSMAGAGTIRLPAANLNIRGPLVVPTAISLQGQGYSMGAASKTVLNCSLTANPCIVVADGLGSATNQGMGLHSMYYLKGPGSGSTVGLWIGGDPAAVFAPATWFGSYTRYENIMVLDFHTTLNIQNANFISFYGCVFSGLTRALIIPSTASVLGNQPIEFYATVLTVPSGAAVQMDYSGYQTSALYFSGGQVSGAITGTSIDWQSFGTHYEPNTANEPIIDVTAAGVQQIRINGGIMSTHGVATPYQIRMSGTGYYILTLRDVYTQCDAGSTVPTFISYSTTLGGRISVDELIVAPAGVFTALWTVGGGGTIYKKMTLSTQNNEEQIAAAASIAFNAGNWPQRALVWVWGGTVAPPGITAVSGLTGGQTGMLYTAAAQTFTAGATIGNTITTVAGVPVTYYFDGTKIWFSQ